MKIKQLTAPQLAAAIASDSPPVLLDCRELSEWNHCRIAGALHLPMSEIQMRFTELDPDAEVVVYCHHGMRSQQVASFLAQQGFATVGNLLGGIDAWSLQVDPTVPRY